jgi:peptidoglycan/LPS O-acetylase OafA/YrhL
MPIEFIGSFLIFGLTLALIAMRGMRTEARLLIVIPIALLCCEVNPWYVAFVAGIGLAALLPRRRVTLPLRLAAPLAMLAAWLAGYSDKVGDFRLLHEALKGLSPVYVQTVSAVIAIMLVETVPSCRRVLSGPVARLAGRMSFPVYLLHVPVLCSAGCIAYLELQALTPLAAKGAAAAITLFFTLGLAWPFALLDVWWTGIVSQAVRRIVAVPNSVTSEVTSD